MLPDDVMKELEIIRSICESCIYFDEGETYTPPISWCSKSSINYETGKIDCALFNGKVKLSKLEKELDKEIEINKSIYQNDMSTMRLTNALYIVDKEFHKVARGRNYFDESMKDVERNQLIRLNRITELLAEAINANQSFSMHNYGIKNE